MRKAFTAAVLILSLLHQGLVMAGNGLVYHSSGEGIAHAFLHWEKAEHHHHDDGSVHENHSDQSGNSHVYADGALSAVALTAVETLPGTQPLNHSAPSAAVPARAAPFLQGPTRPPRLTA